MNCDAESLLDTSAHLSGAPTRPPRQLQRCSRAVCDRMAACEEHSDEADQGASSFAQRAEELFNTLANEKVVTSEAAGRVGAQT